MAPLARSPHRILDVPAQASLAVIDAAYERARRLLDQDAMASYGMFDASSAQKMRDELDEAYATLRQTAALQRVAPVSPPVQTVPPEAILDREAPKRSPPLPQPMAKQPPPPVAPVAAQAASKPRTRLCPPRSEPLAEPCTGAVLRRLREEAGADMEAVCELTKINRRYVKALEEDDFPLLPASVYIRGFVGEYARVLGLDAAHVTLTYMSAYRQWAQARH